MARELIHVLFSLHLRLLWLASFQQFLVLSLSTCVWFLLDLFGLHMSLLVMRGHPCLLDLLNFSRTGSTTYSLDLLKASRTDTMSISYCCSRSGSVLKCRLTPPPLCSGRISDSSYLFSMSQLISPNSLSGSYMWNVMLWEALLFLMTWY